MVTMKEYRKFSLDYWVGKNVRTKEVLRNFVTEIPVGTVCKITDKRGGFTLKTEPCKCCGVSVFIRKVNPEDVQLVKP